LRCSFNQDTTSWSIDRHGSEYEWKITTKWIGTTIRKKLGLRTAIDREGYCIPDSETPKPDRLFERYGIHLKEDSLEQAPAA